MGLCHSPPSRCRRDCRVPARGAARRAWAAGRGGRGGAAPRRGPGQPRAGRRGMQIRLRRRRGAGPRGGFSPGGACVHIPSAGPDAGRAPGARGTGLGVPGGACASGRRCAGRRLRGRTLRVDPGRAVGFLAPLHFRGGARRRPPPPRPSRGSGGGRGTTWRCGAGPPCAAGARTRAAERRPGSREWCRRGVQKLRARSSHSVGRSSRPGARFRPGFPGGRLGVRGRRPPPSVAVHLFRAPHLRVAARIRPGRRRLTRGPRPGAAGELSPRACGCRGS